MFLFFFLSLLRNSNVFRVTWNSIWWRINCGMCHSTCFQIAVNWSKREISHRKVQKMDHRCVYDRNPNWIHVRPPLRIIGNVRYRHSFNLRWIVTTSWCSNVNINWSKCKDIICNRVTAHCIFSVYQWAPCPHHNISKMNSLQDKNHRQMPINRLPNDNCVSLFIVFILSLP